MTEETGVTGLELDPAIENVEIKITVRADEEKLVRSALKKADVEPESRRVYFFDTQDLRLFEEGVVLRARVVSDGADDSTVKLRPVVPAELDDKWKKTSGFEVELDAVGDEPICSAKLSVEQRRDEIDEVAAGTRELHKLFSGDQEDLLAEYGPAGIDWEQLSVLGPVQVRKWELEPKEFPHEITVEEWVLPDRSDLIELSIKVEPRDAAGARSELEAFLSERGLDTKGDQQTKTRTALRFFTQGAA